MDGFLFSRRTAAFALVALGLVASPAWADSFPLGGAAGPMVIDPTTQSTTYVAFDSSATESDIYKSTDWGVTWTFSQALPSVADLEIDPQDHSILYASIAVPGSAVIFKSTDSGVTWSEADSGIAVVSGEKSEIYLLAVDPVDEGVVYAAGKTSGLYKSTDGGQNWTSIDGGIDTLTAEDYDPEELRVDPSHPSTVYFGMAVEPPHGHSGLPVTVPTDVYKSTDGGATWNATGARFVRTAVDPADFSHLVACDGSTLQSSMDGGATWVAGASCVGTTPTIVISDTNPDQIFVAYLASATVWGSTDSGATLNPLYTFPQEVTSIASRSGSVYVGAYDSGLYISRDSGATWITSSSAIPPQTIDVPAEEPTIQAAIDAANNGDTVLVASGTYYELLDFKGKAITLKSSGGAAVTILDGNNGGPIVNFQTGEGNSSVLQGFTLQHAYRESPPGAAVHMLNSSPSILDNIFVDNGKAEYGGAGVAIGGDNSSALILRNYFNGNMCGTQSAESVVYFADESSPVIADNTFANNPCLALQHVMPAFAVPKVYNNTFVGNRAALQIWFAWNNAGTFFSNNLIAFNQVGISAQFNNGTTLPTWTSNLVYGDTISDYQGMADQAGTNGNVSSDPRLRDWVGGDVHLLYGSPAIDAGDSAVSQISPTDFYGNSRVFAGNPGDSAVVDIGAVEYEPAVVAATDGVVVVRINTAKSAALGSSGADSTEPLVFALVTLPAHGSVTITDTGTGAFQYVPASGYIGSDSFTFHITDPYGTVTNTATEQVAVVIDLPPTANNGRVNTRPDIAVAGTLSATTAYAGQKLTFSLVSNPAHGSVTLTPSNGRFRYTPAKGYAGADSFTFEARDSFGVVSNVATESVTVTDSAPKARNTMILVTPNRAFSGAIKATTAYAGQVLSYTVVSQPAHGIVAITDIHTGAYTYTPNHPFMGKDSFTFQAADQWGTASNIATVSVTVY